MTTTTPAFEVPPGYFAREIVWPGTGQRFVAHFPIQPPAPFEDDEAEDLTGSAVSEGDLPPSGIAA